jgi:GNAT superfamily N-acetyltransferase
MVHTAGQLTIQPATPDQLDDLAALFGTNKTTTGCYCVWFVAPTAKQCHADWGAGNRQSFEDMARASAEPVGLLAYRDGEAVGWCAAGPRPRYERALRTAALKKRDAAEDPLVWLVPCFFVRRDARRQGVTRALLEAAAALAQRHGALAIEGFPYAGDARRSASDAYLGVEPLFASCGFQVVSRPSATRVLMRRDLSPSGRPA